MPVSVMCLRFKVGLINIMKDNASKQDTATEKAFRPLLK